MRPQELFHHLVAAARRPGSGWILFLVAVLESSVIPFPLLLLLLTLCLGAVQRAFHFALLCSLGSICGGSLAYAIGFYAWDSVGGYFVPGLFSPHLFRHAQRLYDGNAALVVLMTSITPLSYKACALAAGVFKIDFATFAAASIIGRPLRFFFVAALAYKFGERARPLVERHTATIFWIVVLAALAFFIVNHIF